MKYVIGNWKMHTSVEEAVALAGRAEDGIADTARAGLTLPEVVIFPPFTALTAVGDVIRDQTLKIGAQNTHWEAHGPHTGEVGTDQLKGIAEFVMLGHPERRTAGETDQQVAKRLAAAVTAEFTPLLCVGEVEASEVAEEKCVEQLQAALEEVDAASIKHLLVAYEPQWAISSGQPAEERQIIEVIQALKKELEKQGIDYAVLYGGSVNRENVANFTGIAELDGLVIGQGSLDVAEFTGIIESVAKTRS